MKKAITIAVILTAVAGLSFAGYRAFVSREPAPSAELQMVRVDRGTIVAVVNGTGSILPQSKVNLTFRAPGRVAKILVEEGDKVEAGEILVELETTDPELQVAQAQAALAMSKAQLDQIKKGARAQDLAAAEASLASAQANYQRVLAGPNAEDLAAAEASLASAQANYEKVLVGPNEDEITVANADMEQAAEAVKQAQFEYDKYAWRQGFEASPQAAALHQATINYERAKAAYNLLVEVTDREVKAAAAEVAQAEAQLARLSNTPTPEELAIAQAQVDQAQAALDKLTAGATPEELAIAQAQVDQAQAGLAQAQSRLEDTSLLAPSAGRVARVGAEVGEMVSSAMPTIVLVDLSAYPLDVMVDETDISQVEVGQEVDITLDALPGEKLSGRVTRIDPAGTIVQGIVNYGVSIEISSPDLPIKPDMTADADIVVARKEAVLLVPNRGIGRDQEGKYVEVLAEGRPQKVYIETGFSNGTFTEVVAGLEEGERVIIRTQAQRIREEMRERMMP